MEGDRRRDVGDFIVYCCPVAQYRGFSVIVVAKNA